MLDINIEVMPNQYDKNAVRAILEGKDYPIYDLVDFDPKIIVDVGAYVGATALYFKHYYPNARIFCFEPFAESYRYLVRNTLPYLDIQTFNFGLSDRIFQTPMYKGNCEQNCVCSIYKYVHSGEKSQVVNILRASEVLWDLNHIDILKIDTEGCELAILKDLHGKSISLIMLEFHNEIDRIAIDHLLAYQGYHLIYCRIDTPHMGICYYLSDLEYIKNVKMNAVKIGE